MEGHLVCYVNASGCPNACRHCSVGGAPPTGCHYSLDELAHLRAEWGELISYFEPSAHPDYPLNIDPLLVEPNGGWHVTNGWGIAHHVDPEVLFTRLRNYGIQTLAFTLHGLEDHHDWFVCREGAFQDILRASQLARSAGFSVNWQLFLDNVNVSEASRFVDLALNLTPLVQVEIPSHRVSRRLWLYEQLRPSLHEIAEYRIADLPLDPDRSFISRCQPDSLTAGAWLEKWRNSDPDQSWRHIFEPQAWPPDLETDRITLIFQPDRSIWYDPFVAPRIRVGELSEGRDVILDRIQRLEAPDWVDLDPQYARLPEASLDKLHPELASLRYYAISTVRNRNRQIL